MKAITLFKGQLGRTKRISKRELNWHPPVGRRFTKFPEFFHAWKQAPKDSDYYYFGREFDRLRRKQQDAGSIYASAECGEFLVEAQYTRWKLHCENDHEQCCFRVTRIQKAKAKRRRTA